MENKEYLLSFFVIDNNGNEIDSGIISIDALDERDARTKSMILLQKRYKGNRWEIESITLAE
ncbi:hypothetical protein [Haemophilus haemolyticus]|uniref:hypothetical protein n=1 Tax=Haemophilus haemolyticus TaxID=726 RepID=UPI000E56EEF0|nr:hypothetical protein [Haemophilus haemolyticus]DAQ73804.1 MAG TPA: hypothetical protein [Caudoviricetes sp.]